MANDSCFTNNSIVFMVMRNFISLRNPMGNEYISIGMEILIFNLYNTQSSLSSFTDV